MRVNKRKERGDGETDLERKREREREREKETERETERQRDRETDRQRDKETDRQTDREPKRETEQETERQSERQTDRQTDKCRERERENGLKWERMCVFVFSFEKCRKPVKGKRVWNFNLENQLIELTLNRPCNIELQKDLSLSLVVSI